MIYALIQGGIVVNTIVADPGFLPLIEADYDAVVRIDNLPDQRPGVGSAYVGGVFSPYEPPSEGT